MKRILVSLASIAMILAIAFPVFAEPAPNENFMKAAAARNAYLTAQVPAIDNALKEITADDVINLSEWYKIIPLIDKFQSDRKEAIKVYGKDLITAELNPDLIKLAKLYYKPILNGRDPKGEIKALLAIMTGRDIKEVSSNMSFGVRLLLIVAVTMIFFGIVYIVYTDNVGGLVIGLVLMVIGVGGILLICLG